jgi:uncharacterized membrane protein
MMDSFTLFPYLLALIFIIAGIIMLVLPPKRINYLYGYRTPRAMKNINNWTFAQKYSARQMILGGFFLAVFGAILKFVFKIDDHLNNLVSFLVTVLVIAFVFFRTEFAIKKFEKSL